MNHKRMMSIAVGFGSLAMAGLVAVPLMGGTQAMAAQATGTTYSASFSGTSHQISKISALLDDKSYGHGTSTSGNEFYYCAMYAAGTATANGSVGGNSGIWAVLNNNASASAVGLTMFFFMNGIKSYSLAHYWTGSDVTTLTVSTSLSGYNNGSVDYSSGWTEQKTYQASEVSWTGMMDVPNASSNTFNALKLEIGVASGATVGINPTIY
jgi:hypothetical protein